MWFVAIQAGAKKLPSLNKYKLISIEIGMQK